MILKDFFKSFGYYGNPIQQIGLNIQLYSDIMNNFGDHNNKMLSLIASVVEKKYISSIHPDDFITKILNPMGFELWEELEPFLLLTDMSHFNVNGYNDLLDPPFPDINITTTITRLQARYAIRNTGIDISPFNLHGDDNEYRLLPDDKIIEFLEACPSNNFKYIVEKRDCDDFARIMRGWLSEKGQGNLLVGSINATLMVNNIISTGMNHKFNFILTDAYRLIMIEPQNDDKWWVYGDSFNFNGYNTMIVNEMWM